VLLLLTGFAAFFSVQLIKVLVSPKLQGEGIGKAIVKMFLAGLTAFGAAFLALPVGDWRTAAVYGLAGAGLALILHKAIRLLSSLGDESFIRFLRNSAGK
jgi:hypothetical protein